MEGNTLYGPGDGSSPPYEYTRKPRGCVFYGCVAAVVLAVVTAILIGLGFFFIYRAARDIVNNYAEDVPDVIAIAEVPPEQLDDLKARVTKFQEALDAGEPVEPLLLTADQINALIDSIPEFKGVIAVDFTGDKIRGRVSFPCERIGFPGKFLNGNVTLNAGVAAGLLVITIESAEVKGKPVPEIYLANLKSQNLVKDVNTDPKNARVIARIDKIEVKDGKLVITPKPPAKPEDAAKAPEKPGPKPEAEAPKKPEAAEVEKPDPK